MGGKRACKYNVDTLILSFVLDLTTQLKVKLTKSSELFSNIGPNQRERPSPDNPLLPTITV